MFHLGGLDIKKHLMRRDERIIEVELIMHFTLQLPFKQKLAGVSCLNRWGPVSDNIQPNLCGL